MWSFKNYVLGLCRWFLTQIFQSPWNILRGGSDRSVFCYLAQTSFNHTWVYATEVTFGGSLGNFRRGAGCQRNRLCDWRAGTLSPREKRGAAHSDIEFTDLILQNGICLKPPKAQGSENSPVGDESWFSEGSKLREGRAPPPTPILSLCRLNVFYRPVPES